MDIASSEFQDLQSMECDELAKWLSEKHNFSDEVCQSMKGN